MELGGSIKDAILGSECVIVSTEWPEFKNMDKETLEIVTKKKVIDPNGILKEQINMELNPGYYSVGDIHYAAKRT